jgi:biopolymer transport protein ExbB
MYDLSQRLLFRRAMTWLVLFVIALGAYGTTTVLQPRVALAQAEEEATESGEATPAKKADDESLLVFTYKALGPFYVVVFLAISFVFVALIVMIALMLRRDQICPSGLAEMFESHLNEKRFQEAYELAKADESMLGQVLAAGMSKVQQGHDAAQKAMQDVGDERTMDMEQKIGYLGLIGAVAPMVGLMGTVDGMVQAFRVIANSDQTPKPNELAQGITMALVTTQIGLYIAVPAVILFAYFRNRLSKLLSEVAVISDNSMARFQKK